MAVRILGRAWFWLAPCLLHASGLAQGADLGYLFPAVSPIGGAMEVQLVGKQIDKIDRMYCSQANVEVRPTGKGRATISIGADVGPGEFDIWAASPAGLSAPVRFVALAMPVQTEKEPNNGASSAQEVALPATIAGRVEPGTDADWYRVHLAADDGLTIVCRSATLGGTVLPTLTVLDPSGRELAHDALTDSEPTLHVRADVEGEYRIAVEDRSYRTTTAPFYTLTFTTGPWLTSAFPPSLQRGGPRSAVLYGYHLPGGQRVTEAGDGLQQVDVQIDVPARGAAFEPGWRLSRALEVESFVYRHAGVGGGVRFELLDQPLQALSPSTRLTTGATPQMPRLGLPFDVVGRFTSPRHLVDWYRIAARKDRIYWIEAVGQRLDRPGNLEVIVHDAEGKILETFNDIVTAKGAPTELSLNSRDPAGNWKAPTDGDYLVAVRDLEGTSPSPVARSYRLSIGPRQEGVSVAALMGEPATPRGWSVAAGKKLSVSLAAVRRGGHEGPIEIRGEGLPAGLAIAPVKIGAKQQTGTLTFTAAKDAKPWLGSIRLIASTILDGRPHSFEIPAVVSLPGTTPPSARIVDRPVIAILGNVK